MNGTRAFLFAGSKKPRRSGAYEMRLCNACLVLGQQVGFFQRRAQGQVQDDRADGGQQRVDKRNAAGDLGKDRGNLGRLAEDEAVAEVTDERVSKHVDQQAAERAGGDDQQILASVGGGVVFQVDDLMRHKAADQADDELKDEGGDGITGVASENIGQSQADSTGQAAGDAVQQHSSQRRKGVAQVEGRAAAEDVRDAEELIRNQAEGGHHADDADFLHSKFRFGQSCYQQGQRHYHKQQQPHGGCRHNFLLPYLFYFFTTKRLTNTSLQGMLLL